MLERPTIILNRVPSSDQWEGGGGRNKFSMQVWTSLKSTRIFVSVIFKLSLRSVMHVPPSQLLLHCHPYNIIAM